MWSGRPTKVQLPSSPAASSGGTTRSGTAGSNRLRKAAARSGSAGLREATLAGTLGFLALGRAVAALSGFRTWGGSARLRFGTARSRALCFRLATFRLTRFHALMMIGLVNRAGSGPADFIAACVAAMGFYAANGHTPNLLRGHVIATTLFQGAWALARTTCDVFHTWSACVGSPADVHPPHGNIAVHWIWGASSRGRGCSGHTTPWIESSVAVSIIPISPIPIWTSKSIGVSVPVPRVSPTTHGVGVVKWVVPRAVVGRAKSTKRHESRGTHVGAVVAIVEGGVVLKLRVVPPTIPWAIREVGTRIGAVKRIEGILVSVFVAIVVSVVPVVGVPLRRSA